MIFKVRRWLRMWREAIPILTRLMRTGDVDEFERDSDAFRARYGIGEQP